MRATCGPALLVCATALLSLAATTGCASQLPGAHGRGNSRQARTFVLNDNQTTSRGVLPDKPALEHNTGELDQAASAAATASDSSPATGLSPASGFGPAADASKNASNVTTACELCPPGSAADKGNTSLPCVAEDKDDHCKEYNNACPYPPQSYKGPGFFYKGRWTYCWKCAKGSYSEKFGNAECKFCPYGEQPNADQTNCVNCLSGKTTSKANRTCHYCEVGNEPVGNVCTPCPPGMVSNKNETFGLCKECTLGLVPNKDNAYCEPCSQGETASKDHSQCVFCQLGMIWSPKKGCVSECSKGNQCAFATVPSNPSIKYCASCSPCNKGWYNDHSQPSNVESKYTCKACKAGTFQKNYGASSCTACPDGYYQTNEASVACIRCPSGSYCQCPDKQPIPCPADRYCPGGTSAPKECSEWYDTDVTGCKPTIALIAIIASCSVVGACIMAGIVYVNYRKYTRALPGDQEVLIAQQQSKEPVYTGL
eukprot:m.478438 g.478438  ORF g.478438 m.478438 type:complete len:483 (-) comp21144_c0_seq1:66-1514(-)